MKKEPTPHYEVVIIETHSTHNTREAASSTLMKLPNRQRATAMVLEIPATTVLKKVNPNLKHKKAKR